MNALLGLLLLAAAQCGPVLMINKTDFIWNEHDIKIMDMAKERCPQLYPDSPCLVKFTKTGYQDYLALCGAKQEEE
jgi:hypothetical protein